MHIYFCGSIRGGRQDVDIYQKIVRKLKTFGEVLTEHVSHSELSEKAFGSQTHLGWMILLGPQTDHYYRDTSRQQQQ
ncbi:unnamed protein product [Boreogadus saida]